MQAKPTPFGDLMEVLREAALVCGHAKRGKAGHGAETLGLASIRKAMDELTVHAMQSADPNVKRSAGFVLSDLVYATQHPVEAGKEAHVLAAIRKASHGKVSGRMVPCMSDIQAAPDYVMKVLRPKDLVPQIDESKNTLFL